MKPSFFSLVLLVTLGCVGCGSDAQCAIDTDCDIGLLCNADNRCVPRGGDAALDANADAPVPDAEVPDAAADTTVPDTGPVVMGTGFVTAITNSVGPVGLETLSYSVSAGFAIVDDTVEDPCTQTTVGPCVVIDCPDTPVPDAGVMMDAGTDAGADAGADAGTPVAPNAGTIQVSGGTLEITMTPDAAGLYAPQTGASLLWLDDMTDLTFRGMAGRDVPMFTEVVRGTSAVLVTAPPMSGEIVRGTDLPATWTGTSSGELVIRIFRAGTGTASTSLECRFDPPTFAGMIPGTALGMFPPGGTGSISVTLENRNTFEMDGWTVTTSTGSSAKVGDLPAAGTVTFSL